MRPTLRLENPIDTSRILAARRSWASFPGAGGFGWLLAVLGCLAAPGSGAGAEPLLEGRVLLSSGAPAAGARVRLFAPSDLGRSLRVTTDESGYFAFPLKALRRAAPLPARLHLGQNYPNPFNPSTIIPYQLPAATRVRLEVFKHSGSAGGDPGGRGTAGRFSHGGLERDRRLGSGGGLGGVSVPASWGRGASDAVDGAAGRPGGPGGWRGLRRVGGSLGRRSRRGRGTHSVERDGWRNLRRCCRSRGWNR